MDEPATASASVIRRRLSINAGWRFHRGDIECPRLLTHSDCYANAKAGRANGAASPAFDDSAWPVVNVPHDWASESTVDPGECLSQGYRQRGIGWYRRHFRLDPADRARHLELQFDGIATHCTVWINGNLVHRNWCGYTSFYIDLTPFALFGDELNSIAVRVDADTMEGWWYEGAGIYRHTWLVIRERTHLVTDGVWINPYQDHAGTWAVSIEARVANQGRAADRIDVMSTLVTAEGREVSSVLAPLSIEPLSENTSRGVLSIVAPHLWTTNTPVLYTVCTRLLRGGRVVDCIETPCGFRSIRFEADHGFFLNGEPLKLKGVCNHQDHAGVGVAIPDALWAWRLRQLKKMGVNAYRCSHNPPCRELLDLCDQLGILVMNENRHFNCSPEYVRQLEWLVRRDRNHPSVILWSVFNEEPMQGSAVGREMVRRLVSVVRRLDPTRPVTAAMNGGLFSPDNVSQEVDVVGFNYQVEFYDRFHATNPTLPVTSAEDTSAFMTRGEYATDTACNIRDSYDTQAAPWGATHRSAWRAIAGRPWLAGGFVWTGFDYHGEPTPHRWPSCSSFFGALDLCGFPKTAFHIHRAHWLEDETVLEIVPHWNWPDRHGHPVKVLVITNCDRVTLTLNGDSLGARSVDRFDFVSWEVPYATGTLEAIGHDSTGREIARASVSTTGEAFALELVPDRTTLHGDGLDAQPITVRALDTSRAPVPTASHAVEFDLTGPGAIIGLGNGDPNSHEAGKGRHRSLFNGLAQVILQTASDSTGELILRASAPGLRSAELRISVAKVPPRPALPPADPILILGGWRMSPVSSAPLDPNIVVADHDMNTWPGVQPGELQSFAGGAHALYRVRFTPFAAIQRSGGRLMFGEITGRAEVWLDGQRLASKDDPAPSLLNVFIPQGQNPRTLTVAIHSDPGMAAGLSGAVSLTEP